MTEAQKEQRVKAYSRSAGVCAICGKPLYQGQMQYAHKIGNTAVNRKRFGSFFVDSTYNGEYTCSLDCNASVDVGKSIGTELRTLAYILVKETKERLGTDGLFDMVDLLTAEIRACGGVR